MVRNAGGEKWSNVVRGAAKFLDLLDVGANVSFLNIGGVSYIVIM